MQALPTQVDAVVVGAGQAGLATSHYLSAFGIEHVVVERERVGESWRSGRWDSFSLVTPNWMTRLPGEYLEAGTAALFLPRDALVERLERFASNLPVLTGVAVLSVTMAADGYRIQTSSGQITARVVVVAAGGQRIPTIPGYAAELAAQIDQIDASHYRSPNALGSGAVLIVGGGQSGVQIAEELAVSGRDVLLATSRVARVPRRYRGRDVHEWSVELGLYDQPVEQVSDQRQLREAHPMLSGGRGGHTIALQQLARDGVRLLGRLTAIEDTKLHFAADVADNVRYADERAGQFRHAVDEHIARTGVIAPPQELDPVERPWHAPLATDLVLDSRSERIATVIWATGFRPDLEWLHVPVQASGGTLAHRRGITALPGLYVVGYPWLSNRGSGLLYGVDADAARIGQHAAAVLGAGRRGQAIASSWRTARCGSHWAGRASEAGFRS
jgi:putative flavoprotein involved in K+ transport